MVVWCMFRKLQYYTYISASVHRSCLQGPYRKRKQEGSTDFERSYDESCEKTYCEWIFQFKLQIILTNSNCVKLVAKFTNPGHISHARWLYVSSLLWLRSPFLKQELNPLHNSWKYEKEKTIRTLRKIGWRHQDISEDTVKSKEEILQKIKIHDSALTKAAKVHTKGKYS